MMKKTNQRSNNNSNGSRYRREEGRGGDKRGGRKKGRRENESYQGFSTLNQVAGVPKPHAFHSSIPVSKTKEVREPRPVCPLCGEKIDSIAQAMMGPDGHPVHFDCVLESIRKTETVLEGQTVSYIGHGNFGILEKNEEGVWQILKTIPYEDQKRNEEMKEYVDSLKV